MWEIFWLQNVEYILEVFVAFLMVTAAWIYLDGWLAERRAKTLLRAIAFFALALWKFLDGVPEGITLLERLVSPLGLLGLGLMLASLLIDPVPLKPGYRPPRFFPRVWLEQLNANAFAPLALLGGALSFF